ncbi:MAG: GFA family protein [Burkholderiaceae bacterium]|nr:GFA family protein [Burkholderiaceae bacterium]
MPTTQGICHCTNCKRRTGSAFGISAYFPKAAVIEMTGETKVYRLNHLKQERHFCPTCGTTLFWFTSAAAESIGIAGGCFADEGLPEPAYSVTDRKRWPWVSLPERWKVFPE